MMMLKEGVLSALVSVGDSFNINFWWDSLLNWINSFFQKQQMELCVLGLPSAGKSSLVDAITTGSYEEDMIPTLGFNMREVTKGNVIIKIWDVGGQERARPMWERYCRAVSAIVYVVDAVDIDFIPIAQRELHDLLKKPSLVGIPLLVLGNKIDLPGYLSEHVLINLLRLHSIRDREVCCYMISCKEKVNLEIVMEWLIKHSNSANAVKSSHLYTKELIPH